MSALTVDEASRQLRLNERTVYRLLENGKLRGERTGRSWRIQPEDLAALRKEPLVTLTPELAAALDDSLTRVLEAIRPDAFQRYFTEDDIVMALGAELQRAVDGSDCEIHSKLGVAGADSREYPDLSVIRALEPWQERRGSPALYSVEVKYFSYRGTTGGYRIADKTFAGLLRDLARQYRRLVERVEAGVLGEGAVVWIDAFDWLGRHRKTNPEEVILERTEWLRREIGQTASVRVRFEYLPVRFPHHCYSSRNAATVAGTTLRGNLRGAAKSFITRKPAPETEWEDLIAGVAGEDFQTKDGSAR